MSSRKKKDKTKKTYPTKQIILGILLLGLALFSYMAYIHLAPPPCSGEITECCITNHIIRVLVNGNCDEYKLVVRSETSGDRLLETKIKNGETTINGTFISYENYSVELYYRNRLIDRVLVPLSIQPYIEVSKATLLPNGTLLINLNMVKTKCFQDYGISQVSLHIIYMNESEGTLTYSGPWYTNTIKISTGLKLSEVYSIYVFLTDTLNETIQVPAAIPR